MPKFKLLHLNIKALNDKMNFKVEAAEIFCVVEIAIALFSMFFTQSNVADCI